MTRLAIIPARSGSKGYKDKNIKPLLGKPMINYTIEAALKSKLFDLVHVSTDSEIYADIAKEAGADVSFLRPQFLSEDASDTWSVLRFVINEFNKLGKSFDEIVLLQATSPLRNEDDIKRAGCLFDKKAADAVVSVCEVDHPPVWSNTLPKDLSMAEFIKKEYADLGRQDIDTYYRLNGAIYWMKTELLMSEEDIFSHAYAYIMSKEDSVDIDTEIDFVIAEALLKNKLKIIEK